MHRDRRRSGIAAAAAAVGNVDDDGDAGKLAGAPQLQHKPYRLL